MSSVSGYALIGVTILLTVYGQLVLKWQVSLAGAMPEDGVGEGNVPSEASPNLWVISGFAGAVLASFAWMAVMTKFQLSYAYPFVSLNFVLVLGLSTWLFSESVTLPKLIGLGLIVLGIAISSRG